MIKCPICCELMEVLTSHHCESTHQMTKRELIEQYGRPKPLFIFSSRDAEPEAAVIRSKDFINSQAVTSHFRH